jgi:hypothetical protein
VSAFPYIITMAIFLFGLWLMGFAFTDEVAGFETVVFFGGILAVAAAVAVPIQILGHRESGV